MKYAIDKLGQRISILEAKEDEEYYCPICHKNLLQRRGRIKVYHFAHYPNSQCIDHWHYDMSLWHRLWQDRFPVTQQEIVFSDGQKTHRADVFLEKEKTVIEFQHSEISVQEFLDRNQFYNRLGYRVIWVFDLREEYERKTIGLLDENVHNGKYFYSYPKRIFSSFDYKKQDVTLFFQIKGEDDKEEGITLLKVTWVSPSGIHRFCGEEYALSSFLDFVNHKEVTLFYPKYSIPYHLEENPGSLLILRNRRSLEEYLVSPDSMEKYKIYHHIYGKTANSFGQFKGKSVVIDDAFDPVWVLVWKPKKK
jgi:hypothetical protein